MSIASGVIAILSKLSAQFQDRIERIKNELDRLENEQDEILRHKATIKASQRLLVIDKRIKYLRGLLENKA
jgi:flagellar basal body rod protein FlgF